MDTSHFFEQLLALRSKRPHPCILSAGSENCDFSPYHANGKNCYRIIGHNLSEDCYYGLWVGLSRDCVDCSFIDKCEMCLECVDCRQCFDCTYCQECVNCSSSAFLFDCKNCSDCFGCVNLRNKSYCIFNKQYSKVEYLQKLPRLKAMISLGMYPTDFSALIKSEPHIAFRGLNNENSVGDHIFNSKNAFYCFDVTEQEDTMYIFNSFRIKDSIDCCYTAQDAALNYMCHSAVGVYNSNYCNVSWYSQNLEYCEYVFNSHDCFGCISRNHAEYEILNVKYPKEEYFKRVAEIKVALKKDGSYGRWWWPSPFESEDLPSPSYM